jgi:uncharacterized membrane protein
MSRTRTIEHSTVIEAPPSRVWQVLSRLDGFGDYSPMVKSATLLSEQREGVGAERRCDAYRPGHIDERVVGWEEEKCLALEVIGGMPVTGVGVWSLSGDQFTEVTFRLDYRPKLGPIGALTDRLMMNREMTKGFKANLAGLKAHVEEGTVIDAGFAPEAR